ncbi:MAG TPA: DUF302 domain-containing protein [Mycobacterium sp.]|nr:DUF302 domain-containing protein [Mycobacterium sp.]
MSAPDPREVQFPGVRLRFDSNKTYDELVATLLADVGDAPVRMDDLLTGAHGNWESYVNQVESYLGPSKFMLFGLIDHGGWIKLSGIDRKVLRAIIGNPLIAITMLRHDVTAGLFAPVELLLVEQPDGHSSLFYVKPSSLMVVEDNPPLLAAAQELDAKLAALAAKITGTEAD